MCGPSGWRVGQGWLHGAQGWVRPCAACTHEEACRQLEARIFGSCRDDVPGARCGRQGVFSLDTSYTAEQWPRFVLVWVPASSCTTHANTRYYYSYARTSIHIMHASTWYPRGTTRSSNGGTVLHIGKHIYKQAVVSACHAGRLRLIEAPWQQQLDTQVCKANDATPFAPSVCIHRVLVNIPI